MYFLIGMGCRLLYIYFRGFVFYYVIKLKRKERDFLFEDFKWILIVVLNCILFGF